MGRCHPLDGGAPAFFLVYHFPGCAAPVGESGPAMWGNGGGVQQKTGRKMPAAAHYFSFSRCNSGRMAISVASISSSSRPKIST